MRTAKGLWQAPTGSPLFASPESEPRARRPTDIAMAITSFLVLVVVGTLSRLASELDDALVALLDSFPGWLGPLWRIGVWAALSWALFLIGAALVRRRRSLARDLVLAVALAIVIAVVAGELVLDDGWQVISALFEVEGPPGFPPGVLAIAAAAISTASPHLSRPYRHLGRWLILLQFLSVLFLGGAEGSGAVAGVATGLLAAAVIHLAVGSPGGRPDAARIQLALRELGVEVDELMPAAMQRHGAVLFEGQGPDGPLSVKVYGRDAWDGQLLSTVWQLAWYRDTHRTARLSRVELVEHEGFVTLLAERGGVRVPHLVTAGSAGRGDALVVVRRDGDELAATLDQRAFGEDGVVALWSDLARLHDSGITHRQLDLDRILLHADGTLGFGDLSSASVTGSPASRRHDRAQLLALSILLLGEERALAVATTCVGHDALLELLPYLQDAAVPGGLRDVLQARKIDLDDVRGRYTKELGAGDQPLIKLRRVSIGSLVNLALLVIATYTLIGLFSDLDLDTFVEEIADARWWWLVFALLLAQLPRIPSAVSTMGSLQQPLPLGPLVALQFAICYINLAIPSTAARVAVNVRFFQRFGVGPTKAVSAGVIDSVAGFAVQIVLLVSLFFLADLDFELNLDPDQLSGLVTIVMIVIAVTVLLVVIALLIPAVRRRVVSTLRQGREALQVLRSPSKLVRLVGGNVAAQVLFAVALSACVRAFNEEVTLSQLIVINTMVSLFAGLMPVPGGIGVTEAGLTVGLTAAGVNQETAFAIAIAYRFASFYLPPIWGWFCYRWLIGKRYL